MAQIGGKNEAQMLTLQSEHVAQMLVPALKQEAVLREAKISELKVLGSKLSDAQKSTRAKLEELHAQSQQLQHLQKMDKAPLAHNARIKAQNL